MIRLDRKIDFMNINKLVRPACVPLSSISTPSKLPYDPNKCVVMGWGQVSPVVAKQTNVNNTNNNYSEQLLETLMPLVLDHDGISPCQDNNNNNSHLLKFNTESQICAGKDGSGTCLGDAGGPLACPIINNNNNNNHNDDTTIDNQHQQQYCIIGIITILKNMCQISPPLGPEIFTKVNYYVEWLQKNTRP